MTPKAHNLPKPGFARFRVEYDGAHKGYRVVDPDGRRVYGPGAKSIVEAKCDELQAARDAGAKRGLRKCLCCRVDFQSEGFHNRLCKACRSRDGGPQDCGFHPVQRGQSRMARG